VIVELSNLVEVNKILGGFQEPIDRLRAMNRLEGYPGFEAQLLCQIERINPILRQGGARFPDTADVRDIMG